MSPFSTVVSQLCLIEEATLSSKCALKHSIHELVVECSDLITLYPDVGSHAMMAAVLVSINDIIFEQVRISQKIP